MLTTVSATQPMPIGLLASTGGPFCFQKDRITGIWGGNPRSPHPEKKAGSTHVTEPAFEFAGPLATLHFCKVRRPPGPRIVIMKGPIPEPF
jgi:hypothetical protein